MRYLTESFCCNCWLSSFDELHYGRFISFYIKGIFFFDSQPPLGKQLVAATAYLAGYNGENNFTAIGAGKYDHSSSAAT